MEILKKYYKNILLVMLYTFVALSVYVCLIHSYFPEWYYVVIVTIVIIGIGVLAGFLWIRALMKEDKKKEAEAASATEENKE